MTTNNEQQTTNKPPLLQFASVEKSFFGVPVLKNVSFTLPPCGALGLVGENGAGKSTLMNILGGNLRADSGVTDRKQFTQAMNELQASMIVVPEGVYYQPKFTYIWTLGLSRFPDQLTARVKRDVAVKEIARCFLSNAGLTIPGELARVTGLSRPEAGLGNRALVKEGVAIMLASGWYQLKDATSLASPRP